MKNNTLLLIVLIALTTSCASVKKTMWVGGYKSTCDMGAGKGECLVVNQSADANSNKWETFYAPIENFNYKEGTMQKIRVRESKKDKNSTAQDQSNIRYELLKVESTKPDPRNELQGVWSPVTINGNTMQVNDYMPSINFDLANRRVAGSDGCNKFTAGIAELSLSVLKFQTPAGTKKACPDMSMANLFNTSLASITQYRLADGKLMLMDEFGKDRMTLKKGESYTKHALSGPWILVRLNENPVNRKDQLPTLEMNIADQRIFGSDGCNNYTAPLLNATEKQIKFGVMMASEKACRDMTLSEGYNAAMQKVESYKIAGNMLTLFDATGKELLAFMKRN